MIEADQGALDAAHKYVRRVSMEAAGDLVEAFLAGVNYQANLSNPATKEAA